MPIPMPDDYVQEPIEELFQRLDADEQELLAEFVFRVAHYGRELNARMWMDYFKQIKSDDPIEAIDFQSSHGEYLRDMFNAIQRVVIDHGGFPFDPTKNQTNE